MASMSIQSVKKNADGTSIITLTVNDSEVNLGQYAVHDNTYDSDTRRSDAWDHFFRFPSRKLPATSIVTLYIGYKQLPKTAPNNSFLWDIQNPVWNQTGDQVHLLRIQEIDKKEIK